MKTWNRRYEELRACRHSISGESGHTYHTYNLLLEELLFEICDRLDKEDAAKEENR